MDYNSNREKLLLPEYGRNVQMMVDFAMKIEDRDERNKAAKTIISIMGNMYPHLRDVSDFRHKLWDHLAIMTDFKFDIDSPYELPTKEKLAEKPQVLPYNNHRIKFRHYGKIIESMVKKAIEIEDEKEQSALILMIANHMKKSYANWNKEGVTDEKIFKDIVDLSKGKLNISANLKLRETHDKDFQTKTKKKTFHKNDNRKFTKKK
ncbi:DUF4290 domain-containing protein [Ancylomarina salipaludis]|uniref:DUF4290 domain-containing protein n=1 Tax=Ancylomarina salipaludis TaxID=2501299 RepID=A0A4Q1JP23_9BACT|nr:DUF4290 domain-containing protein [Ancylomarina salipaludis]RXQ96638.1 DUF4290 domain-containing protein [Ancylomarina salipaludis]